jgi:hypothetical protein
MSVTDKQLKDLMTASITEAVELLNELQTDDRTPMHTLLTVLTATAVLSKAMGLPLEHLLEGLDSVYRSIGEGSYHVMQ